MKGIINKNLEGIVNNPDFNIKFSEVPHGSESILLEEIRSKFQRNIIFIASDIKRYNQIKDLLSFTLKGEFLTFPQFDTSPYDRITPNKKISSERIKTLIDINESGDKDLIILSTVRASAQYILSKDDCLERTFELKVGMNLNIEDLATYFISNGYIKTETVREYGDFSVRGGIIDFYSPSNKPVRLDFFGNTVDAIKIFDTSSQVSIKNLNVVKIYPNTEICLNDRSVKLFRTRFNKEFGPRKQEARIYKDISEKIIFPGMENWMPFFFKRKATILDHINNPLVIFDHNTEDAYEKFVNNTIEHYLARMDYDKVDSNQNKKYYCLDPGELFLDINKYNQSISKFERIHFTPFNEPEGLNFFGKKITKYLRSKEINQIDFDKLKKDIGNFKKEEKKILIACSSRGSIFRLGQILDNHKIESTKINEWKEYADGDIEKVKMSVIPLIGGFEIDKYVCISEQDIFGEKFYRQRSTNKAKKFIKELSNIIPGDYVVHIDHGIGRFENLETIEIEKSKHECLLLKYSNNDRLYLPVENLEVITKYGSEGSDVLLDKLGGGNWERKKTRIKNKIKLLAKDLIEIAAKRNLSKADIFETPNEFYNEFCSRFPYEETEDQTNSIEKVIQDLKSGKPMDRLICGDVGFGKTEVALRAAFLVAMKGKQVVILTPTTLLARQHFQTFLDRFSNLPIRVNELSRLSSDKKRVIEEITNGVSDITIGTHSLLSKKINFKDLGLLIIDEEQHFGVRHKEHLKRIKSDIHVLTLTATPIPRTLQLAMTGVRDLSIIATPPVDRRSIGTFIFENDNLIIKEALMRERYRGGQSFYIVPRISDIKFVTDLLNHHLPDLNYVVAHGQMASKQLEERTSDFYKGEYDILVSTSIIQSGLDIPNANTLIIHKSNLFGLSQLYQIRGRVGRSNVKAYSLITYEKENLLGSNALKRLEALQSLDSLGAGFNLASYDMDIRGSGNLLGEEQSGHIKEIGLELYQEMLQEAVLEMKDNPQKEIQDKWSPKISLNLSTFIPETYIEDINIRMDFYRRLSVITENYEVEKIGIELVDRFGNLPDEVKALLDIILIKNICKSINIEKIESRKDGHLIKFKDNFFKNADALIDYVSYSDSKVKFIPNDRIFFKYPDNLNIIESINKNLEDLVELNTL